MINWLDLAAFGLLLVLIAMLVIANIAMAIKLKRSMKNATQLATDKLVLMMQLERMTETNNVKSLEETQGFIKFISDSRDWAFQYIEDVQKALTEYDEALSSNNAKLINEKYKSLIGFLPDDDVVK